MHSLIGVKFDRKKPLSQESCDVCLGRTSQEILERAHSGRDSLAVRFCEGLHLQGKLDVFFRYWFTLTGVS